MIFIMKQVRYLYLCKNNTRFICGDNEYDFPADFRKADMDSFSMGPKELVTNGEFTSDISSWTTGDGSPSHTTSGNGRLNLNDAAAYQAINTTVNKQYKLQLEF